MKKLIFSAVASTLIFTGISTETEAKGLKASDLKVAVKSYNATLTKDVKVYKFNKSGNPFVTFKKGTKVTVVERRKMHGYDYLVLKGKYVMPLKDAAIKIGSVAPGKYDYFKYIQSKDATEKIKNADHSSKYFNAYKKYVQSYDKSTYYGMNLSYAEIMPTMYYHYKPEERGGLGGGRPPLKSFKEWMNEKDYTNYLPRNQFVCEKGEGKNTVNIFSKSFINDYFGTNNRNYGKFKVGRGIPYEDFSCGVIGSDAGHLDQHKDVSVKLKNNVIKEVFITPTKKYSYNEVIKNYGKPTTTKFIANGRVEHQLIYNHSKKNGFQVIVALDNYKGNVKYLRKMND